MEAEDGRLVITTEEEPRQGAEGESPGRGGETRISVYVSGRGSEGLQLIRKTELEVGVVSADEV